jgi:hypothetical protein
MVVTTAIITATRTAPAITTPVMGTVTLDRRPTPHLPRRPPRRRRWGRGAP